MIETDKELEQQLIRHEALRLKAYKCPAEKLTIGVGRNLDDVGLTPSELQMIRQRKSDWVFGDDITEAEALAMLRNDIIRVRSELRTVVYGFDGLTPERQRALADMCFNLGLSRFSKFKKMLAAVEAGDFARASAEMKDSRWARQVGDKPGQRAHNLMTMMWEG